MDVAKNQEYNFEEEEMGGNICNILHEYCLLEIFSYLKIQEVFRMEKVCVRFREISRRIYKTTRILNIIDLYDFCVTIPEAMMIMSRVEQYIYTLTAERCIFTLKKGEIPRITPFCESDYVFDLKGDCRITITNDEVKDEPFSFPKLKRANLSFSEVLDEELCRFLPMDQLETLDISDNEKVTGYFFKSLKNIIELNISGVKSLVSEWFEEFCAVTPNLRSLNLFWTFLISADFKAIAQNLKNLESLEVSDYYCAEQEDFHDIADLPKLKHLKLHQLHPSNGLHNEDVDYLVDETLPYKIINLSAFLSLVSRHNRLESLFFRGMQRSVDIDIVTHNTMNMALRKLKNLKVLQMQFTKIGWRFWDCILENFTAQHKIQELHIDAKKIKSHTLEMFIMRCPTIRLMDISQYDKGLDMSFLENIRDCLSQRFHVLEIRVAKVHQKACEELINGRVFKNLKLLFKVEDTEDF